MLTVVSLHPTASHLDNICTKFTNEFSFIVNTHAPLKQLISKTKCNQKFKPWLTKSILKSIKTKNKHYANCYKQNNSNLISKYKQYSNKLTTIKRLAKEQYYTSQLLEHKSNISKQWAVINDLLGKTTDQNNAIHKMLKHDKQMTKNKDEISNILNDYFVNIGPNLSAKINNRSMSSIGNILCSVNSFFLPIVPMGVYREIHNLNLKKAEGPEGILFNFTETLTNASQSFFANCLMPVYKLDFFLAPSNWQKLS